MVGRQVSMIKHDYGEIGESLIDEITNTLRTRNAALLFYTSEQKCFHLNGFSETRRGECIEILRQIQSDAFQLEIEEGTDQDIIRFQLIPILSESDIARTEHEFAQFGQNIFRRQRESRSQHAIRARFERLQEERQSRDL